MAQKKPVVYPNLLDAVKAMADAHTSIHDTVKAHAQAHQDKLTQQRNMLKAKHAAKKLTGG